MCFIGTLCSLSYHKTCIKISLGYLDPQISCAVLKNRHTESHLLVFGSTCIKSLAQRPAIFTELSCSFP